MTIRNATSNTTSHAVAVRPAAYGHGTILASAADEARKSTQGRRMIRERVMALGKDSIYNLTGLVRPFPLHPQDLEPLENQFTYYIHFLGRAEELALHYTGAKPWCCHYSDYGLPWRCSDVPFDDAP